MTGLLTALVYTSSIPFLLLLHLFATPILCHSSVLFYLFPGHFIPSFLLCCPSSSSPTVLFFHHLSFSFVFISFSHSSHPFISLFTYPYPLILFLPNLNSAPTLLLLSISVKMISPSLVFLSHPSFSPSPSFLVSLHLQC